MRIENTEKSPFEVVKESEKSLISNEITKEQKFMNLTLQKAANIMKKRKDFHFPGPTKYAPKFRSQYQYFKKVQRMQ